jgi:hypothetical protein
MGACVAASAISTSSSSPLSSDSSLLDELSFLSFVTPGSGSEDSSSSSESDSLAEAAALGADFETGLGGAPSEPSSEDSSLEPDSGLTTAFAEEALVVETMCLLAAFFAEAFAGMGLEGTSSSSEAEDSSSADSSLDSSLELDSGLATAFAGDVLVAADFMGEDAFTEAFVVAGLMEPSSDSSSDDSSLDSSLELDVAASAPFVGGAFTAGAFVGTGLACVGLVAAAPLVAALGCAPFAGAALAVGFDGSSSESSSLSLSLRGFAEAFGIALVAFGGSLESLSLESEADSPSLDPEEDLALGGTLDYIEK